MSQAQDTLQKLLDAAVVDGRERGVQLAVYHQGKLVIDAWAGTMAAGAEAAKVDGRTLFPVFSCTKGLVATLAHKLVERGQIAYDTPIAKVWPEFAANGKEGITLGHALGHTSGLQFMPQELTREDVGEVLRRVDGRPFEEMLDGEIKEPLGLGDMYVGLPAELDSRVAELEEIFETGPETPAADDKTPREVANHMRPLHAWMNTTAARRACVPASNGIMNARDLARHYAALVPGGVDGVELLPASRVKIATQRVLPTGAAPTKNIALGYFLSDTGGGEAQLSVFGHAGYGGANGFADPDNALAVGFTKNLYSAKGVQSVVFRTIREALGIPQ